MGSGSVFTHCSEKQTCNRVIVDGKPRQVILILLCLCIQRLLFTASPGSDNNALVVQILQSTISVATTTGRRFTDGASAVALMYARPSLDLNERGLQAWRNRSFKSLRNTGKR
jgi:hypothetical protein